MSYILKCFGLIFDIYFGIFLRESAITVRIGYHVSFGFVLSRDMVKVRSTKGQHSQNLCNDRVTHVLWIVFDVEIYHDFLEHHANFMTFGEGHDEVGPMNAIFFTQSGLL